jgi:hypothetical protein
MAGRQKIDIIGKVLDALYAHNTHALFVMSLMHQYEERGSLSKKQLEGLLAKARKVPDMPAAWLGTLEAIILRMPTRYKSDKPVAVASVVTKDEETGRMIEAILHRYPQHKRVLFFKSRYTLNQPISAAEKEELRKFMRLPGVVTTGTTD